MDAELDKYHALVQATLDYELLQKKVISDTFDSHEHWRDIKTKCEVYRQKGQLNKLKKIFRDLTEPHVEMSNMDFDEYLRKHTGFQFSIFESLFEEVEKLIAKQKIKTEGQYYNAQIYLDKLINETHQDQHKITLLESMMEAFGDEQVKKFKNRNKMKSN
jgi:hypothetical protein